MHCGSPNQNFGWAALAHPAHPAAPPWLNRRRGKVHLLPLSYMHYAPSPIPHFYILPLFFPGGPRPATLLNPARGTVSSVIVSMQRVPPKRVLMNFQILSTVLLLYYLND